MSILTDVGSGESWFLETLIDIMRELYEMTESNNLIDALSTGKIYSTDREQQTRFDALTVFVRKEMSGTIKPTPPSLKLLYKEIVAGKL
jgi:hypothetical protein